MALGESTFSAGVCLHEFVLGASFGKLRRKSSELGQDLVDQANFGGKAVLMNVEGQKASYVACSCNCMLEVFLGELGNIGRHLVLR